MQNADLQDNDSGQAKRLINVPRFWCPYLAFLYQPLVRPPVPMSEKLEAIDPPPPHLRSFLHQRMLCMNDSSNAEYKRAVNPI